jgi:hypothetical protein
MVTGKGRGLNGKPPTIFYLLLLLEGQGRTAAGWLQSPATRAPRSLIELRNRKRRLRGSRRCAHHGGRSTGVAGFRRGAAGGGALEAVGLHARAALRCFPGDGRVRRNSASRSCWWRRFFPVGLHAGEPASRPAASLGWPAAQALDAARPLGRGRRQGTGCGAALNRARTPRFPGHAHKAGGRHLVSRPGTPWPRRRA